MIMEEESSNKKEPKQRHVGGFFPWRPEYENDPRIVRAAYGRARAIGSGTVRFSAETLRSLHFPQLLSMKEGLFGGQDIGSENFYYYALLALAERAHSVVNFWRMPVSDNKGIVQIVRKKGNRNEDDFIGALIGFINGDFRSVDDDEEAYYFKMPKRPDLVSASGAFPSERRYTKGDTSYDVILEQMDSLIMIRRESAKTNYIEGIKQINGVEYKYYINSEGVSIVYPFMDTNLRVDYKWKRSDYNESFESKVNLNKNIDGIYPLFIRPNINVKEFEDGFELWKQPIRVLFDGIDDSYRIGPRLNQDESDSEVRYQPLLITKVDALERDDLVGGNSVPYIFFVPGIRAFSKRKDFNNSIGLIENVLNDNSLILNKDSFDCIESLIELLVSKIAYSNDPDELEAINLKFAKMKYLEIGRSLARRLREFIRQPRG